MSRGGDVSKIERIDARDEDLMVPVVGDEGSSSVCF
jgi:hypothetical protein